MATSTDYRRDYDRWRVATEAERDRWWQEMQETGRGLQGLGLPTVVVSWLVTNSRRGGGVWTPDRLRRSADRDILAVPGLGKTSLAVIRRVVIA